MDMTNFLKQSKLNSQNSGLNGKNNSSTNLNYNNQDLTKKASSLDSINAVERELDEVLKDLELNSQDLNEQLQEAEYNHLCNKNNSNNHINNEINNNNNNTELPINIQKSMSNVKIENLTSNNNNSNSSSSSSSNLLNRNNGSLKWTNNDSDKQKSILNSEFLMKGNENELYLDDNLLIKQSSNNKYQMKSNEELNKKLTMQNNNSNGVRKQRQNIISTYELCNECFDSNMLMTNTDGTRQSPMISNNHSKCCKNHKSNCSDFTNYPNKTANNNGNNNLYHQVPSPVKFANSNQDLTQTNFSSSPYSFNNNDQYFHGRPKPPLAQINESIIPDNINNNKSMSLVRNGNNHDLKSNGSNHVISQKVITIGMPTKNINGQNKISLTNDQSPSPKLSDARSKSIPVPKTNGINNSFNGQQQNGSKDEDKLDKLPPVPPSTWSTNPSIRRRNHQQAYVTNVTNNNVNNGRLNKLNGSKQNTSNNDIQLVNLNGNSENNEENQTKINELNIHESGSSSLEEDEPNNKNESKNNQTKNYDNFDLSENDKNENNDDRVETTISKDPRYRDFGFSISDNLFGNGIFINRIRNGSPAESNPHLIPFSQIFKVFFLHFTIKIYFL